MFLKLKKWWWNHKGYWRFVPITFSHWKVGTEGSVTNCGRTKLFTVRGLEPPDAIWVELKKK